jgi:hypothetical protein
MTSIGPLMDTVGLFFDARPSLKFLERNVQHTVLSSR